MGDKRYSWTAYAILAVVCSIAVFCAYYFRDTPTGQSIASIPVTLSLIGALYMLYIDEARHEKEMRKQRSQQLFDLGVTSHMADVAFDKYVEFCEKYVEELESTLVTLWREAETPEAIDHASNLLKLRKQYVLWLTGEIEKPLERLEKELRRLGASAHLHRVAPGEAARAGRIQEMFDSLNNLIGINRQAGEAVDDTTEISSVIIEVRRQLGIPQLHLIRRQLIDVHTPH